MAREIATSLAKTFNVGDFVTIPANTVTSRTEGYAWDIAPKALRLLAEYTLLSNEQGRVFTISTATPPRPVDPYIEGTDISVYRIAALIDGGVSVSEILTDFPSLTRRQVEDAEEYAKKHPYSGKQYPKKTFKHFLRKRTFQRLDRELSQIEA